MNSIRPLVRELLPSEFFRGIRSILGKGIRFSGNYEYWDQAASLCSGYDSESILEKVLQATLKVKSGEAIFERDSVLFDEIQYSWPVTATLMWAAARNKGSLHVLDFGGSLGSSYFQNRKFLSELNELSWSIVEQRKIVSIGRDKIADGVINFFLDIDEYRSCCTPNFVLLSSVLQYLSEPFNLLVDIAKLDSKIIVVDRTPFAVDEKERIKIQHVPSNIYSASYPCWFFSRTDFVEKMKALDYQVVESFDALDKLTSEAKWLGMIFEKAES